MSTKNPKLERKRSHQESVSPWTGNPIPKIDWPEAVRAICKLQHWLVETDDEASTDGLITADLFLKALDEAPSLVERIESILDGFGKLAYSWSELEDLPHELRRRIDIVMTAATEDLDAHIRGLQEFAADPSNLFKDNWHD